MYNKTNIPNIDRTMNQASFLLGGVFCVGSITSDAKYEFTDLLKNRYDAIEPVSAI
jgi:hypothetical protein